MTRCKRLVKKSIIQLIILTDKSKLLSLFTRILSLNKLKHYGIRGLALDWIKDYLNDRKQYVDYNNVSSEYLPVKYGVPQESILGPLLFLLYMNITYSSDLLKFILFAVDTSVFYSSNSISDVFGTINYELSKVFKWLVTNKLSVNVKKLII